MTHKKTDKFCFFFLFLLYFRIGYNQASYEQGYYFTVPQYDNHKGLNGPGHRYTNAPIHQEIATDIQIQKSHSYEVPADEPNYVQQGHGSGEDSVPVIVLRIPGPTKYAKHLQALLQQYLELRAVQYLKALEEQERQVHYMQYMAPQVAYYHQMIPIYTSMPGQYYSRQQYQPMYYDNSGYDAGYIVPMVQPLRAAKQQQSYQDQSKETYEQGYHQPSGYVQPHSYAYSAHYNYNQGQNNDQAQDYDHGQQYDQGQHYADQSQQYEENHHGYEQHNHQQEEPSNEGVEYTSVVPLKTVENYPSEKHTQVIFKSDKAPVTVYTQPEQEYQPEEYQHQEYQQHQESIIVEGTSIPSVVEITQRPVHNYHAHAAGGQDSKREAPYTEEQFNKYNQIIQRLKKQTRQTKDVSEEKKNWIEQTKNVDLNLWSFKKCK